MKKRGFRLQASGFRLESGTLLAACALGAVLGAVSAPRDAFATAPSTSLAVSATGGDGEGSPLYPIQRISLRFDHRRHAQIGLSCAYCHTAATTSRRAEDRLLPPPDRCDACHGTNHEHLDRVVPGVGTAKDCAFCHEGHQSADGNAVRRAALPPANVVFDHAAHTSRGIACARCHAGVEKGALATENSLPKMRVCTTCHAVGAAASGDCDECHLTVSGSRLRTAFAEGPLVPPAWMHDSEHGPDWLSRHKLVAGTDSTFCANCHKEEECVDCHDGRVRPRHVHPNDWLNLHAMAARDNDPNCSSCHRAQSFCITCHERTGVAMSGPYGNATDRGRFHPPRAVWTDPPRTAQHHAWEAERNIEACVSCHTERDCASCHATAMRGGRGGLSPHPPGFDVTCRNALAKNARPCLFCHDVSDPSLAPCR